MGPKWNISEVILGNLVRKGLSRIQIATKLKCKVGKVHHYLHKYKLKIKTKGSRLINLVGRKYGRLTVIQYRGYYARYKNARKRTWWLCD